MKQTSKLPYVYILKIIPDSCGNMMEIKLKKKILLKLKVKRTEILVVSIKYDGCDSWALIVLLSPWWVLQCILLCISIIQCLKSNSSALEMYA